MYRNCKLVVFGASSGAKKVVDTFKNLSISIEYVSDNNKSLWGQRFEGIDIVSPDSLVEIDCYVVIASMYYSDIYNQLIDIGVPKERVIPKENIYLDYFDEHQEVYYENSKNIAVNKRKDSTIIIDASEGYILSGAVKWSLNFIEGLKACNYGYCIFVNNEPANSPLHEKNKNNQIVFNMSYENYRQSVEEMYAKMLEMMPCTVVINTISQVFFAAYILKEQYPEEVRIISVIHSDFQKFYDPNYYIAPWIDRYVCVSQKIMDTFSGMDNCIKEKSIYINSPVVCHKEYRKLYPEADNVVNIAYAGRLEKAQKRADLIIEVIKELEKFDVCYRLNIAGDGSYKAKLEKFILENNLSDKVILLGTLSYDDMDKFWKENDIYINVSDCEGMCLAMLEAMSYGLAPVVTDTSGVKEIINNEIDGFVSPILDIKGITENIVKIINDKDELRRVGCNAKNRIEGISDIKKYALEIICSKL